MDSRLSSMVKQIRPGLSLTGVIVILAVGVILPVLLSTGVGIISIVLGEQGDSLVFGILVICFAAASIGGAVTATILLGRKARTARLQADFVANVTHELHTPLSAIRMCAQTLQSGGLDNDPERAAGLLSTIVRETRWLETMIERVLTWRSAAQDRTVLDLEVATITPAVEHALKRFSVLVGPGEVELAVSLESGTPVSHDRFAVASVVLNLLVNAYRYTGEQKRIAVRTYDEDGDVIIEVEDNGVGVPFGERKRIFEPFYKVDTRLKGSSGAGLGLAISKALVTAHGGEIGVKDAEPVGACFYVRLPGAGRDAPVPPEGSRA